jgi:glycosyltransferase involved in cell wall biosynthesis
MHRVLLVVTKGVMGGAQRYVASLAEGLRRYGFETEAAFGPGEELGEWCRAHDVPVHRAALDNPIRPHKDFLAYLQLLRLMRRGHYDIVHLNSTKAGIVGLAAARTARVPVRVFTAHGLRSVLLPSARQRAFWTWMETRYTRPADCVIEVSEYGLRVGREKGVLSPDRSLAIHNGISLAAVEAGRQAGRRRRDVGLEEADLVVGTVGRLDEAKGMGWWLRAAALVARQEPRARFLIIGDGPERDQLAKLSEELGLADRVRWTGTRPGIEYLPLFDVFLQSSLWPTITSACRTSSSISTPTRRRPSVKPSG